MKSKRLENRYETACKNCLFAVYDHKTQIGCRLGRLDKYIDRDEVIEVYDEEAEFYVIKGICNTVRQTEWNNGVANVEKVMEEARPKFDVYIDSYNISQGYAEEIIQFYDDVSETDFDINWTIVADASLPKEQRTMVAGILRRINARVVEGVDLNITISEEILKSRRAFSVMIDDMSVLNANIFNRIDTLLNEDLRKFVYYALDDTHVISNLSFHIYSKNLNSMNFLDIGEEIRVDAEKLNLLIMEADGNEEEEHNNNYYKA